MRSIEPARTPSVQARRAQRSEAKAIAAVLADSFARDPVVSHLLRDAPHTDAWREYFQIGVEVGFARGEVWTTDALSGACIFFAPGRWQVSMWQELKAAWRIARATSMATTLDIRRVFHLLEDAQPRQSHCYLLAIGVTASQRNRGLGAALMRPMLDRCQEEQAPAYLENTDPNNKRFYERFGFQLTRSLSLPNGTPPIDLMWRELARSG